jgi:archaellum component FlaG (FlaF/FlaG flagellin family)
MRATRSIAKIGVAVLVFLVSFQTFGAAMDPAADTTIASSLAAMVRAGRSVISANQAKINDPSLGAKGLDSKTVLAATLEAYKKSTGNDATAIDPKSRQGILLGKMTESIVAVMDHAQADINVPGVGFKGFIPAVFGRLVSEEFNRRAQGLAVIKITAPPDRVRNRTSMPDDFEKHVIQEKFLAADWQRGAGYAEVTNQNGVSAFRVMSPEYYADSCLACHGTPKGEIDITGYPREGFAAGDLGGVISITLFH